MIKKLSLLLLLITTLGLSACANKPQSDKHYASLTETYWKLVSLQRKLVKMTKHQAREIHFILAKKDQRVSGFSGCNQFWGGYQLNREQLKFSEFMNTRMACSGNPVKENDIFMLFKQTNNYQIEEDKLSLYNSNHQKLAVFEAVYLQ